MLINKGMDKEVVVQIYNGMSLNHAVLCLFAQSCPTLFNPIDYSPPGSTVQGILQARILEWVVMPSSIGSSQSRDWIQVSHIADRFFTAWATREALLSHEKNKIMLFESTRMDLETVMLSKVSQTKANIVWYQLYVGFFFKRV